MLQRPDQGTHIWAGPRAVRRGLKWLSRGPKLHLMSPQQPPKGLRWLVWVRGGWGRAGVGSSLVYGGLRALRAPGHRVCHTLYIVCTDVRKLI